MIKIKRFEFWVIRNLARLSKEYKAYQTDRTRCNASAMPYLLRFDTWARKQYIELSGNN
jgi:hypothetical protein